MINLRDIPKEQAKLEIQTLLKLSPCPLDHGEIADKLELGLKLVAETCTELVNKGVIEYEPTT